MATLMVPLAWVCYAASTNAEPVEHAIEIGKPVAIGGFSSLKEPSGIAALDENTLLVIEDEKAKPLRRLTITDESLHSFKFSEHSQNTSSSFIKRRLIGPLDDLEGIARLSENRFFIIGSHENASRGQQPLREKLLLLTREANNITQALMRQDLYEQLAGHIPELKDITQGSKGRDDSRLNIEGLAFDRKRNRLLIGLRTPTINENAVVISLNNAEEYLGGEDPVFSDRLYEVDLDKQGIRALAYDDRSDQLLVVGKRESGKKKRFALWTLDADTLSHPVRYRSESKKLFDDVEGLTPINDGILFVRDGGDTSRKKTDRWFILTRTQLGLDKV